MKAETNTTPTDVGVAPKSMKAMVQERYGPAAEVLTLREVPVPDVGPGEVLVRVHSSSVNAMEWHLMNGKPYLLRPMFGLRPRSATLGADLSGTIVTTGADVTRFVPGDRVFGEVEAGAYAEFANAAEGHLVPKPSGVSFEEAAVVGVAGLTALQGLRDVLEVRPGEKVLINGGSGGVGTYAIQVAKVLGAEVTVVCSTRNVEQARRLGADTVVDYEREDITRSDERFDAMFDIAGNHGVRECKRLLAPGGRYVMVGGPKGNWLGPVPRLLRGVALFAFGTKKLRNFVASSRAEDLEELGRLLAAGEITSVIEDRYPLPEVVVPLDRQGEFHARAKTLIEVEGAL